MLKSGSKLVINGLRQMTGEHIVSLTVNGSVMLAAFELCPDEHERRLREGVGAITSTALLCGLWDQGTDQESARYSIGDDRPHRYRLLSNQRCHWQGTSRAVRGQKPARMIRDGAEVSWLRLHSDG